MTVGGSAGTREAGDFGRDLVGVVFLAKVEDFASLSRSDEEEEVWSCDTEGESCDTSSKD